MARSPKPYAGTRVAFLFGRPVSHSLSPAMHQAAFAATGFRGIYAPLEVEDSRIALAVGLLRMENVLGANVTVPLKQSVIAHLDGIDPVAERLQSVNTIYRRGAELRGTSTDGPGFLRSLGPGSRRVKGGTALLVGAGGASRAVAGALRDAGLKRLLVTDLQEKRVEELLRLMKGSGNFEAAGVDRGEAERLLPDCRLIVQATPVGLHEGDPSPLSLDRAVPGTLAVDLVYHRRTEFLRSAEKKRLVALDGLGMLLHQGALSFEKWTFRKAPLKSMAAALKKALRA